MNRHSSSHTPPDQLSLDDLRAYQADQLTGAARHRVERLLLENPFYADALDGLDALQQVGGNLKLQTRDLHVALQERVHESATTQRLMPLWVTSLVASVLLVLSVSIYLIFNTAQRQKQAVQAVPQAIEPGTILIDPDDLGTSTSVETTPNVSAVVAKPIQETAVPGSARKISRKSYRTPTKKAVVVIEEAEPVMYQHCSYCAMNDEMPLLPKLELEAPNRRYVNTERAFLN
ncbi:hypothetical protein [Fibrella aquatica]|uniref:hypothetical protein n=1 Tax=Fibrella aquatica TaxID=3242487 RepID=UPI00352037E4